LYLIKYVLTPDKRSPKYKLFYERKGKFDSLYSLLYRPLWKVELTK